MSLDALRNTTDSHASTNSTSADSSGGYPKREERVPYIVIYRDTVGVCEFAHRPQRESLTLTYEKQDSSSSWELVKEPDHFERFWMDPDSFRYVEHIVSEVLGSDLRKLLTEAPETALKAIDESARVYDTDKSVSGTRPCPVCSAELHRVYDEFENINGKRVCPDHPLSELKTSGLLDQGGMPRNRIWE